MDLQTSSQRLSLCSNLPRPQLVPEENISSVIHHEVKEMGTHMYVATNFKDLYSKQIFFRLVCEVSYQTSSGIPMSFRKFYKIMVLKPLDVKTKFYNAENDDVYLEAQVQNLTTGPISLEKVDLDASHLFNGKICFESCIHFEQVLKQRKQNL